MVGTKPPNFGTQPHYEGRVIIVVLIEGDHNIFK
jgi:hypothetical protein